jgi:hypothetical protein
VARRREKYDQARALHAKGASVAQIARTVGIARMTVSKYLREGPSPRKRHSVHGRLRVLEPWEPPAQALGGGLPDGDGPLAGDPGAGLRLLLNERPAFRCPSPARRATADRPTAHGADHGPPPTAHRPGESPRSSCVGSSGGSRSSAPN